MVDKKVKPVLGLTDQEAKTKQELDPHEADKQVWGKGMGELKCGRFDLREEYMMSLKNEIFLTEPEQSLLVLHWKPFIHMRIQSPKPRLSDYHKHHQQHQHQQEL